ncbi:NADPH:quinone reductase-like Zn-dependent oxidoreductase [Chitinophaga niastensis]|uniref:NADPH:quinone reductase-like Zn-dependent oxidoreductase n=1 Tax=Chitinophaga niastensis TaxID=536980 RepID=A0A2P8HVU3_CHINA|nr:zinc-binding dehydrogenase [Chitinophaga niastensis]PSL50336.1 NADPH:quinone reductase-like Zn-dependent oxidoreductase [Chitinophaga niastensis]
MKAIVFDKIGLPAEVLQLRDIPVPDIKDNEVLVRTVSASINPGDFLFIQNLYPAPKRPVFPQQIAGNHGAGIIEKTGKNVSLPVGTYVAFSYYNTWAEYVAVPAEWLMVLPAGYPIERAGQFMNAISAWDLLHDSGVQSGQWLALTAGNSSISMMVSQFAKNKGVHVISIVRKMNKTIDLKTAGASAVINLSDLQVNIREQIMEITGNKGLNGIIDNVGGPITGELIRSTAFGAKVIINGGMSPEKFELHNFDVLLNGIEIKSHVYRYFFTPPKKEDVSMLEEIAAVSGQAGFQAPIGGTHALEDFITAINESIHHPGSGKHVFNISDLHS